MPERFGARLRQHREERQISLTTIADRTKISVSLLEGLERDDVSRWPSGLFRRAFARAYASAIGLDPEEVVREFLIVHPDPADAPALPCNGTAIPIPPDDQPAPSRLKTMVGSAFGSFARRQPTPEPARVVAPVPVPLAAVSPPIAPEPIWHPDVRAAARVCADLARVTDVADLKALLARAADVVGATGAMVWLWDAGTGRLRPALAHGYADEVLKRVAPLGRDADNATAAVFRSAETAVVRSGSAPNGAVVAPLVGPVGPVGVLALEVGERASSDELVPAIFAAQLAVLVGEAAAATEKMPKRTKVG
jgi:transcriptional regulator with XRE-family HTH domain